MPKKTTSKKIVQPTGRVHTTLDDAKTAALLVSVTINLAVLIGWIALKVTNVYDAQVAAFLFGAK